MNLEAQLTTAMQQLNQGNLQEPLRYHYGKVRTVNEEKDTCVVHIHEVDLEAEVNLRVGQGALNTSFVTYPKIGSQILFLSPDETFGRAYILNCSEIDKVVIRAEKNLTLNANAGKINIQNNKHSLQSVLKAWLEAEEAFGTASITTLWLPLGPPTVGLNSTGIATNKRNIIKIFTALETLRSNLANVRRNMEELLEST